MTPAILASKDTLRKVIRAVLIIVHTFIIDRQIIGAFIW